MPKISENINFRLLKYLCNEKNHVLKLLSNSFARVSTPLHSKGPRCVAANLSIDPQNNERFLLNFISKRLTTNTRTTLENLFRYAFKKIPGGYLNIAIDIKYSYIENN